MDLRDFGIASAAQIEKAQHKLGVTLPEDYKKFLLQHNGGSNPNYDKNKIWVKDLNDHIILDTLFGVGLEDENLDAVAFTDMFQYDMLPDSVLIGDSIQHGFFVMICSGEDQGVYYWDHSYAFESSDEEGNMYWIAKDFRDFVRLLGE